MLSLVGFIVEINCVSSVLCAQQKSTMAPKCLTLLQKSQILEDVQKGTSVTALAKQYGVAKSTICSIKTKASRIVEAVHNTKNGPGSKRSLKTSAFPRMEQELYKWFLKQQKEQFPVSGLQLREKAISIHDELRENGGRSFSASDGWLQKFKKRYGIRLSKRKVYDNDHDHTAVESDENDESVEFTQHLHEPDPLGIDKHMNWNEDPVIEISDVESNEGGSESDDEIINEREPSVVSNQDAVDIFEKALQWAVQNQIKNSDILVLQRLKEKAEELVTDGDKT